MNNTVFNTPNCNDQSINNDIAELLSLLLNGDRNKNVNIAASIVFAQDESPQAQNVCARPAFP